MLCLPVMRYCFGPFELHAECFELRENGLRVEVEPQVLAVLHFLVINRHRLVTRDEIIEAVWHGRIVSEAAISSRIKSARHAVGDNGEAQRVIRTVHGRGFRFVAEVDEIALPGAAVALTEGTATKPTRPSIAVLPLSLIGDAGPLAIVAEALPQELIRELARLRWLFVIARGSSFRFIAPQPDIRQIGEALGVRYILSGTLEALGGRLSVAVELTDTRDGGVVWAERFQINADAVHELRAEIVAKIISALEIQIPLHEANYARLALPEKLDAWSTYHLGLQHMYRFTAADNAAAANFFARAISLEPSFARAHAGLSFTHFQDAFLDYTDRATAIIRARRAAETAVSLDPFDPFANLSMGRSHWLLGDLEGSLVWLNRSTDLSPHHAQGTYAKAWAQTLLSHGSDGQQSADEALALSPLDPLRYAMLATRALSHLVRGEDELAAVWAERGVREPGAHALIAVIAAACRAATGDVVRARSWIEVAKQQQPALTRDRFFRSFPFAADDVRARLGSLLQQSGL